MMQASEKLLVFFYWCLQMLLVSQICKLSAQVSKSVSRRWGHVYVLHARFAAQLRWREGGRLSRQLRCEIRPSHILLLSVLVFFPLGVSAAPLMFDQPPKKQPRGLFILHVFRAKGSHRYQGETGEV